MTTIALILMYHRNDNSLTDKVFILIHFVILFLSLGCSYSFAETNYQKELENFAESLIFAKYESAAKHNQNEKLHIEVAPLDKRLTFTPCLTDLTGEIVGNEIKKNISVKITCSDSNQWTTYVRARVKLLLPRVVTTKPLSKGQTLVLTNIKLSYVDKLHVRNGSFSDINILVGTRLKRNLSADRVIKNRDICFVCKNDKVSIRAVNNGLSIKASGIALSDANIGGTVRVRNSHTQRIVVGRVSALKEVQVSF
ncbi:MAG: flagella basal body P-ring formation protein FlgA [Oleiphilaceae bacterium]|jgi:flagella basal body P-ring formation protein FlgA